MNFTCSILTFECGYGKIKTYYVNINVAYIIFLSDSPGLDSTGVRCFKDLPESQMHGEEKSLLTDLQPLCSTFFLSQPGCHSVAAVCQTQASEGMELGDETWVEMRFIHLNPWAVGSQAVLSKWACQDGVVFLEICLSHSDQNVPRDSEIQAGGMGWLVVGDMLNLGVGDYSFDPILVQVPSILKNLAEISSSPRGLP